jgi:predicted nucleic-acid-binding Zn-ribbon protein
MGFFSKDETRTYEVNGTRLKCVVCQHEEFEERHAQLNTAISTLLNFDWADTEATCLVCDNCDYVHWFLPRK